MCSIGQENHPIVLVEATGTNHSTGRDESNMLGVPASTLRKFDCMTMWTHIPPCNQCLHASTSSSMRASVTFYTDVLEFSILHAKHAGCMQMGCSPLQRRCCLTITFRHTTFRLEKQEEPVVSCHCAARCTCMATPVGSSCGWERRRHEANDEREHACRRCDTS